MCKEIEEYYFRKQTRKQLSRILSILIDLVEEVNIMSVELDALVEEVAETEDVEQSAIVLLEGIMAELEALIAENEAGKIDTAKLVELKDSLAAKKEALAAAVAAVPPAPVP